MRKLSVITLLKMNCVVGSEAFEWETAGTDAHPSNAVQDNEDDKDPDEAKIHSDCMGMLDIESDITPGRMLNASALRDLIRICSAGTTIRKGLLKVEESSVVHAPSLAVLNMTIEASFMAIS